MAYQGGCTSLHLAEGTLCERRVHWPYDQTSRRIAESTVQDVDLDDLVLEVVVVEVVVLLVEVSAPTKLGYDYDYDSSE